MTQVDLAEEATGSQWIYDEALARLAMHYGDGLRDVRLTRAVVGVFVTAVALSTGYGGVAFTSPEIVHLAGCDILRGHLEPLRGRPALDIVRGEGVGPFTPIIRLATLNALSAPILTGAMDGSLDEDAAFAPLVRGRRVCMIGAMIPLIKRLEPLGWAEMLVADRKGETLAEVRRARPVDLAALPRALAGCETLITTGATIPNGSLAGLLDQVAPDAAVVVVGPTAGFVPEPLFARNVAMVATTLVTEAERTLDIVAEGGAMYHLFHGCLRKINLPNLPRLRRLGLDSPWR